MARALQAETANLCEPFCRERATNDLDAPEKHPFAARPTRTPHPAAKITHFANAGVHDADELSRAVLKDFKLLE
jgi:hypothetical protein